jgi:hypothetical protein
MAVFARPERQRRPLLRMAGSAGPRIAIQELMFPVIEYRRFLIHIGMAGIARRNLVFPDVHMVAFCARFFSAKRILVALVIEIDKHELVAVIDTQGCAVGQCRSFSRANGMVFPVKSGIVIKPGHSKRDRKDKGHGKKGHLVQRSQLSFQTRARKKGKGNVIDRSEEKFSLKQVKMFHTVQEYQNAAGYQPETRE